MVKKILKWSSIVILLLVLVSGVYIYSQGIQIRQIFMGTSGSSGEVVGRINKITGKLKRQPKGALEFINATLQSQVFSDDTLMTGEKDFATIELNDGSLIELAPGSLIRLSFENSISFSGIKRKVLVDVLSGQVEAPTTSPKKVVIRRKIEAAPVDKPVLPREPVPEISPRGETPAIDHSPEPIEEPSPEPSLKTSLRGLRFLTPRDGASLSISPGQLPPLRTLVSFFAPEDLSGELILLVQDARGQTVLKKLVPLESGEGKLTVSFQSPGRYQMELLRSDGSELENRVQLKVTINSQFKAIRVRPPLVAGKEITSNAFQGERLKEFDVQLRWEPLPSAERYRVRVTNSSGQELVNQMTTSPLFSFPKDKIYNEPIYYGISSEDPSGFIAVSPRQEFLFNFLPPQLTLPKSGTAISSKKAFRGKKSGVLFTWQRTNFTRGYEFEISTDDSFQTLFKQVRLKENFIVFKNLKPGNFYWRVRAISGTTKSAFSAPHQLVIQP